MSTVSQIKHVFVPPTPRTKDQGNSKVLAPRSQTQRSTDRLADYLVDKFQSPEYRPAFLKLAWQLDEGTIHRLAGSALELGSNPRAYFIACAKNELRRKAA